MADGPFCPVCGKGGLVGFAGGFVHADKTYCPYPPPEPEVVPDAPSPL